MDEESRNLLESIPKAKGSSEEKRPFTVTEFARKDLLRRVEGKLYGNWSSGFDAACFSINWGGISENAIIELRDIGECSGGMIVLCRHY